MSKFLTSHDSIHFNDETFEAKDGVIEGNFPPRLIEFFGLKLVEDEVAEQDDSQSSKDPQKDSQDKPKRVSKKAPKSE